MQKHILSYRKILCWLCLIIAHDHFSQTNINYQWCNGMGGISSDMNKSVQVDASGNVYIAGYYSNTVDFDPGPGTAYRNSSGNVDAFIAKYDANGNYLWAISFGDWSDDRINYLALDAAGNVYVTGRFSYTVDFDFGISNAMFTAPGGWGMFFAKYDTNGNYQWAHCFSGGNSMEGNYLAIDNANNLVLTGTKYVTIDMDPGPSVANVNQIATADAFLAKYDQNGNYIWAFGLGGGVNGLDVGRALVTDGANNIYVTGFFTKSTDFDPGVGTTSLTSVNGADAFYAKYDANGNYQWAKSFGSGNDDYISAITLDAMGNVLLAGSLNGSTDLDPGPGTANLSPTGLSDALIAKYDNNGNYIWAINFGGSTTDGAASIKTDSQNNIYVSGGYNNTADMDPGLGLLFLSNAGWQDMFIAKYNASGNVLWAHGLGSSGFEVGADIKFDAAGNLYMAGCYGGNTDFDPNTGTAMVNWVSNEDIFVAKYSVSPTGISEDNFVNTFNVFPNPASGFFNVRISSSYTNSRIEICNALGEIVARHDLLKENNTIDVSGLAKGMYVYRIISESDRNSSNGKLIVD